MEIIIFTDAQLSGDNIFQHFTEFLSVPNLQNQDWN